MTTNLIWILYRSDSDTAYKETLNCKKIIEGYGKKVLFSEISNETNNISQLFSVSKVLPEIALVLGGDGTVLRPKLNQEISDEKWDEFVYLRKSPRGKHIELWHHIAGCRQWFQVQRDTVTHEIFQTAKMSEEIK